MLELVSKIQFDPVNVTNKHEKQSSWKSVCICNIEGDIHLYYAWFLKKRFNLVLNPPLRGAHVTIINDRLEDKTFYNLAKQQFNNKELIFQYNPKKIRTNGDHWWISVDCEDAKTIREVCGLDREPFMRFHLTLGYAAEGLRLEHSNYIHRQILKYDF
jgi:hypothetical protein